MKWRKRQGFTLIEIIIALVVFSFLATLIVSFGINIPQSASSVLTLSKSADLQRGMDDITRAYYNLPLPITHANLNTFRTNLVSYISAAGISVDAGRTKFVTFDAGAGYTEIDDASANAPNLKVTLVNSEGQSASTVFTTR